MGNLVDIRSNLINWKNGSVSSLARSAVDDLAVRNESGRVGSRSEEVVKARPKIIENIQLVPPRGEVPEELDPRAVVEVEMEEHG